MRKPILGFLLAVGLLMPPVPARAQTVPGPGVPDGGPPLEAAPAATFQGVFRAWTGTPTDEPGRSTLSRREVIVSDHPFDDRGADTDGDDGRSGNPTERDTLLMGANAAAGASGDYVYPPDAAYGRNAADIVEVRVAADVDNWYLLVAFNTLVDPSLTAVEAGIEGHTLVAHGSQGSIDGLPVEVIADASQNTFEIRIPRSSYDPGAEVRNMFVASGLWDAAANDWMRPAAGVPPYFDLAYVPREGMDSYWRDKRQSLHIASSSFAEDVFRVDFGRLVVDPCETGGPCKGIVALGGSQFTTRTFRSGQPLGEGIVDQTRFGQDASFDWYLYRSRYQPYALYVPRTYSPGPRPLVLLMHFLAGNHMSYPITSAPGLQRWADDLGAIVAMPLGRGEAGWYEGEAEKDVFEVWRDVATHYPVDRERVYAAGMSMGGFGSWRLGHLYPDQFAKAIVWSGPVTPYSIWPAPAPVFYPYPNPPACDRDAAGCGYTLTDLFGNASNLPYMVIHGGADELVPSTGPEIWMERFAQTGSAYRYVLYPTRRHETPYPGSTEHWVREWLGDLPARVRNPNRVTYKVIRDLQQPEFGILYDGSYWVDGLRLADGASEGQIDADRSPFAEPRRVEHGDRFGIDAVGLYRLRGRDVYTEAASSNAANLRLRGLSRAVLDVVRMGWDLDRPAYLRGETDTAIDVVLHGPFPHDVLVEGAPFSRHGADIVLHVDGPFSVSIRSS